MNSQLQLEKIRNRNFSEMLRIMRKNPVCNLSQISEKSTIGLTTIKKCMEQGIQENMVFLGDFSDSSGGRKAQQYILNKSYQYFLFILVDNNDLLYCLYDFSMHCVEQRRIPLVMREYLEQVEVRIEEMRKRFNVGTVCLSIPCVLKGGKVIDWYYNPELCGFDLKKHLEDRFHIHVIVQNDMKLTVLGAGARGGKDIQNMVTAQFGHNGIGVGEMVNGHVLEGVSGFAGEVGYINDARKNIMGVSYPAKILRNVIVCINPQKIVFYKSPRQNYFEQIFSRAVEGLPHYAIPEYEISGAYLDDIALGCVRLIDRYAFFRRTAAQSNEEGAEI